MTEIMKIQNQENKEAIKNTIDEKTQKKFDKLLKDIDNNKNKAPNVANILITDGKRVLDVIMSSLQTKIDEDQEKNSNTNTDVNIIYNNQSSSNITTSSNKYTQYKLALKAFEEDITKALEDITKALENIKTEQENINTNISTKKYIDDAYWLKEKNNWWKYEKKEKELNTLLESVNKIYSKIPWVDQEIKEANQQIEINALKGKKNKYLNMNLKTPSHITEFFEGDKEVYDAILADVFKEKPNDQNNIFTITKNTEKIAHNVYQRVETYIKAADPKIIDIGEIKLGKATAFDWTRKRFDDNERVIQYNIPEIKDTTGKTIQEASEEKFIVQGNKTEMQTRIAENALKNSFIPSEIKRTETYRRNSDKSIYKTQKEAEEKAEEKKLTEDPKKVKVSLNIFDDVGNFVAFKNFIENADGDEIKNNLKEIITQLIDYEPSTDTADAKEDLNTLKNWYADVFTNHMLKQTDLSMLEIYTWYITKENLNLLGADEKTRTENYNKIFFSDATNNVLRPEIKEMLKNMKDPDEKKILLENIAQTRIAITGEKATGTIDNLKEWFDAFIDAFGPMLFGILGLLWVSKATLLEWFPNAAEKINEKFTEEYGLSPEATKALQTIAGNTNFSEDEIDEKKYGPLDKAESLKKAYEEIDEKEGYLAFMDEKENYQHINVNVFSKWLELYNKKEFQNDTTKYLNLNDIVNIKTNNKKEYIDSLKNPDKDNKYLTYKTIIETLIDDDSTRSRIASANADIQTPATYKKETLTTNKQWLEENDYERYNITSEKDIVRYLTASLFSDKDLSYVMTENQLNNGANIEGSNTNPLPKIEVAKEVEFTKNMYDNTAWVTQLWWSKMIHEIIDMSTAPEKIQITRKSDGTKINCTLKMDYTDSQITTPTPTYIDDTNKRVKIFEWDKIEAIQTPEYRYQENNKKIKDAMGNIVNTDPIKYKTFYFWTTFIYDEKAIGDKKKYQDELLTPISDILTDEEQFKLLFSDTDINQRMTEIWPVNLKNTFTMMDNNNTTKKYEALTNNIKDPVTSIEAKTDTITITQADWTITIKYDGDELKTERTPTSTSTS